MGRLLTRCRRLRPAAGDLAPEADLAVGPGGGEALAVGAVGDPEDAALALIVQPEGEHLLARHEVEDLDLAWRIRPSCSNMSSCSCEAGAVGAKVHLPYATDAIPEGKQLDHGRSVIDPDFARAVHHAPTARCEKLAVGAELQRKD